MAHRGGIIAEVASNHVAPVFSSSEPHLTSQKFITCAQKNQFLQVLSITNSLHVIETVLERDDA